MKKNLCTILSVLFVAALLAGCGNGGRLGAIPTPHVEYPPAQPTVVVVVPPAPTAPAPAPTQPVVVPPAPTTAPAPSTGCLDPKAFAAILNKWHKVNASEPGPAINEADQMWEQFAKSGTLPGATYLTTNNTVNAGPKGSAIMWTNLAHGTVSVVSGAPLTGKWLPLFTQGDWGFYALYDTVNVPSSGRVAYLCDTFHPDTMLDYWGK